MTAPTLLDKAAEALWEAWMAQHKISGGKEYASFDDLCRYATNGQEPAQHYLAAMHAEVRAVARVILGEPASEEMHRASRERAASNPFHPGRSPDWETWGAMSAARLSEIEKG